jgi:hypothetical protein
VAVALKHGGRKMKVLDKTVQMNEDFKPVMLITLELPLSLNNGIPIQNDDFMMTFYKAIKAYDEKHFAKQLKRRNKP